MVKVAHGRGAMAPFALWGRWNTTYWKLASTIFLRFIPSSSSHRHWTARRLASLMEAAYWLTSCGSVAQDPSGWLQNSDHEVAANAVFVIELQENAPGIPLREAVS